MQTEEGGLWDCMRGVYCVSKKVSNDFIAAPVIKILYILFLNHVYMGGSLGNNLFKAQQDPPPPQNNAQFILHRSEGGPPLKIVQNLRCNLALSAGHSPILHHH